MELEDLLEKIASKGETPPTPPIFAWTGLKASFWKKHFGHQDSQAAWRMLTEHAADRERQSPLVTAKSWELLLEQEKTRRSQRLWSFDHFPDGARRPDEERSLLRSSEIALCANDLWHWLNHHAWIETPHARDANARIAPLVYFPGQAALIWWLRDGIRVGRETGRTASVIS